MKKGSIVIATLQMLGGFIMAFIFGGTSIVGAGKLDGTSAPTVALMITTALALAGVLLIVRGYQSYCRARNSLSRTLESLKMRSSNQLIHSLTDEMFSSKGEKATNLPQEEEKEKAPPPPSAPPVPSTVVTCGHCGANVGIPIGKVSPCPYCGAPVQG